MKSMNKNFVTRVTHSEHKNFLLNKKCLAHLMNRIQIERHNTGA